MIEVAFFDVDGVLRHWGDIDPRASVIAFAPDLLAELCVGRLSDADWRRVIAERCVAAHGDEGRAIAAAFSATPYTIDREVVDLMRTLRGRARLGLLTNQSDAFAVEDVLPDGGVDLVVNSAVVGFAKPEPEIFHAAARLADVPIDACFFVDDRASNVEAARAAGMHASLYTSVEQLRHELEALNLTG